MAVRATTKPVVPQITPPRTFRPVLGWAAFGAFCLTVEAYMLFGWVTSSDFRRVPSGPTPLGPLMKLGIITIAVGGAIATTAILYVFLLRPWRRERRIGPDGLMLLAFWACFWHNIICNFFQPWQIQTSYLPNFGSWYEHIPGWISPQGSQIPEPLFTTGFDFVYLMFGGTVFGCWMLRRAQTRWPQMGRFGLLAICFVFFGVLDIFAEQIFVRAGAWVFPGAHGWATLFRGHYYQFPLYEPLLIAPTMTAFVSMRYFRNDRGETFAERGIDKVALQGWRRTGLRFVAIVGMVTSGFLVYQVPAIAIGMYSSPWPEDIVTRSYFNPGLCGPGSEYACPGPAIPVNRPNSVRIGPDGRIVAPVGTEVPWSR